MNIEELCVCKYSGKACPLANSKNYAHICKAF